MPPSRKLYVHVYGSKFVSIKVKLLGEFDLWKGYKSMKLERKTIILIKLSFKELSDSRLVGLHMFSFEIKNVFIC